MTDISYTAKWDCVIALEDWLSANFYTCKLNFDIETDNGEHQNIAFERTKVMIEALFQNSLFISLDNPLLPVFAKKTKQKIITLPNEPLDIIVAAVIYNKCNAIMEDHMIVNSLELSSTQGENICVHFDDEFNDVFTSLNHDMFNSIKEQPWWLRSDASTGDWFEQTKKEVKFHRHKADWDKTLQWESSSASQSKPKTTWKPTIIDGGKTQH